MKKTLDSKTLQTALTLISAEYVKECVSSTSTGGADSELLRLKDAGLGGTKNARMLRNLAEIDTLGRCRLVNAIKKAYPRALIVPYADLFRVMKEYNLSVGMIDHYTGIIPEENIDQICEAAEALNRFTLNNFRYIDRIRINRDMPRAVSKLLASYVARFPLLTSSGERFLLDDVTGKALQNYGEYRIQSRRIENGEWLIAAPVADLPENTTIEYFSGRAEERKRIAEDPIVFKASYIGAVIVSMWGEEADSSIFDKYR